ncbi:MAG: hypothetical protein JXM71_12225, partial [Spirochaetales bacterium]|nr:hypothetical protein [Spirochaetales bacterium]
MLVLPRMTSPPDPVAMGDKGRGDATVKEPSDKSFVQMLSSLVKAGGEPAAQLGSVQLGAAASPGRSNA